MKLAYKWQAAIVAALALFMAVLDNTIVSVALPRMAAYFHVDQTTINWVVTAYFLSQAAIIPAIGYLSDLIGSKYVFLGALALFTIGSALCAFSPSETTLIIARIIQGIGGGALFPIAFAITFRVFPPAERGPASAVIGIPVLLAPVFGPTIGGYLTKNYDWPSIFKVNLPLGVIVFTIALFVLYDRKQERELEGAVPPSQQNFDYVGLILSIAGTTALVFGINQAASKDFGDIGVWPFLASGLVLLIGFVIVELRVKDPVIDIRLFRNPTFTLANILTWVLSAFLFGSLFLLPFFFENVQGKDAQSTGVILIAQGVGAVIGVIIAGRFYNTIGPRTLAVAGMLCVTVASFGLSHLTVNLASSSIQGWLVLRGLGFGMVNIPLQTLSLSIVSNRQMARASSLVNVTRQIFTAIGISLLASYLTHQASGYVSQATTDFTNGPLVTAQANCAAQFSTNPAGIAGCIGQFAKQDAGAYIFQHSYTNGLSDTFLLVSIGCVMAVVLAIFVGKDPAVEEMKAAKRRGETVESHGPAMIGE